MMLLNGRAPAARGGGGQSVAVEPADDGDGEASQEKTAGWRNAHVIWLSWKQPLGTLSPRA